MTSPDDPNPWASPYPSDVAADPAPTEFARWPADYGTAPYANPTPTDGFSVAALVLGIVPFTAGLLGVVFGIIGIRRTRDGRRSGRGMAVAGLVTGSLWLVGIAAGVAVSASGSAGPTAVSVPVTHDVAIDSLTVGECINNTPETQPTTVPLLSCAAVHDAEVFAIYTLPKGKFPGDAALDRFAFGGCDKRFDAYVDPSFASFDWDIGYFGPTALAWAAGDRHVYCMASHSDASKIVGTVRVSYP